MPNLKKITLGFISFIAGYLSSIILATAMPTIIEVGEAFYTMNTGTRGLLWLGVIMVWILLTLVVPAMMIIGGIREETDTPPIANIIAGVVIFLFGIMILIKGWYMVSVFAGMTTDPFLQILFYTGLLISTVLMIFITPIYLIIHGTTSV